MLVAAPALPALAQRPARWYLCRAEELRAGTPGITTRAEVARAFPKDTHHGDPGPGFPLQTFLEAVRAAS